VRKEGNHIAIAIHSIVTLWVRSRPCIKCLWKSHLGNIFTLHGTVKHYYALLFPATVLQYILYKCLPNVISTFYVGTRSSPLSYIIKCTAIASLRTSIIRSLMMVVYITWYCKTLLRLTFPCYCFTILLHIVQMFPKCDFYILRRYEI
jgi:hypothetical protein